MHSRSYFKYVPIAGAASALMAIAMTYCLDNSSSTLSPLWLFSEYAVLPFFLAGVIALYTGCIGTRSYSSSNYLALAALFILPGPFIFLFESLGANVIQFHDASTVFTLLLVALLLPLGFIMLERGLSKARIEDPDAPRAR